MSSRKFWGLAVSASLFLPGCTSINPSDKASVAYNKAFSKARDEVTVLNILRASQNQPLQFSAITNVTGQLKYGAKITLPFTNIIAGGADEISPAFEFTNRNPAVTIIPLANEKFVQGISKPLNPAIPYQLVTQGWPRDIVLKLSVGGVVCTNGGEAKIYLNRGDNATVDEAFASAFEKIENFTTKVDETSLGVFSMSHKDAISFVKNGVGEGRKVRIQRVVDGEAPMAHVEVFETTARISGVDTVPICAKITKDKSALVASAPDQNEKSELILRSVQGMYLYLGNLHRRAAIARGDCQKSMAIPPSAYIINIRRVCSDRIIPDRSLVNTRFFGERYVVAYNDGITSNQELQNDQTPEVLALLSNLLDYQINDALLKGTGPIVSVAQ